MGTAHTLVLEYTVQLAITRSTKNFQSLADRMQPPGNTKHRFYLFQERLDPFGKQSSLPCRTVASRRVDP
jgi:hypothetical protein